MRKKTKKISPVKPDNQALENRETELLYIAAVTQGLNNKQYLQSTGSKINACLHDAADTSLPKKKRRADTNKTWKNDENLNLIK